MSERSTTTGLGAIAIAIAIIAALCLCPAAPIAAQSPAAPPPDLVCELGPAEVVPATAADGSPLWQASPAATFQTVDTPDGSRLEARFEVGGSQILFRPLTGEQPSRFRLEMDVSVDGFDEIDYLAFGWQDERTFWQDRVRHVRQGVPLELELAPDTAAFSLANGWQPARLGPPRYLRVVVKGRAGEGARIGLGAVRLHPLPDPVTDPLARAGCPVGVESFARWYDARVEGAKGVEGVPDSRLYDHWRELGLLFPGDATEAAEALREEGVYQLPRMPPVQGRTVLEPPDEIGTNTTRRFRWHALDMVQVLVRAFRETGEREYLTMARDRAVRWMTTDYQQEPTDKAYGWYDHGVANRQVALLLLWEAAVEERFEVLFARDLLAVLYDQASLLASPSFYARNQPFLHHNHAIFQDLALLATVDVLPELPGADAWRRTATDRLVDQYDFLVTDDGASIENSFGYHRALARLCGASVQLIQAADVEPPPRMAETCDAMDGFSRDAAYPDGTFAAYGDAWRASNELRAGGTGGAPIAVERRRLVWPESGYAVVSEPAGQDRPAWQLNVFASDVAITHKHADFLSFTLWMDGSEWLIDPGFYNHGESPHALYGPSAHAHNAVVVGGRSYEPQVDGADLSLDEGPAGAAVVGRHRGYGDVTVERRFTPSADGDLVFVDHTLLPPEPSGPTTLPSAALWFHAGDGIEVEILDGGTALLTRATDGRQMAVVHGRDTACELFTGVEEGRLAGWFYPSFGKAREISSWRCETPGNDWSTALVLDPDPERSEEARAALLRGRP